jgi:hypothetical protein
VTYATVTQLKSWLDISSADDDALLSDLIDRAQGWIESHTSRVFEVAEDESKTFDYARHVDYDGSVLFFGDLDCAAITSITNGDGTTISAAQFLTLPRNLTPIHAVELRQTSGVLFVDSDDITVVGRWGYSVTPPDVITHATIRLAAWLYRQRDTGMDADRAMVDAHGFTSYPAAMPRDVYQMLVPYRRSVV